LDETTVGEQQQGVTAEESTVIDEEVDQPGLSSASSTLEAVVSSEPALQSFELGFATANFLHELLVTLCITHVISCIWCVNTSVYVYV